MKKNDWWDGSTHIFLIQQNNVGILVVFQILRFADNKEHLKATYAHIVLADLHTDYIFIHCIKHNEGCLTYLYCSMFNDQIKNKLN